MFQKKKRIVDKKLLKEISKLPCVICGSPESDPSHIKTVGSGGDDVEWNVFPKCRAHHTEWGTGISKFLKKYPAFKTQLLLKGWEINEHGKLTRR